MPDSCKLIDMSWRLVTRPCPLVISREVADRYAHFARCSASFRYCFSSDGPPVVLLTCQNLCISEALYTFFLTTESAHHVSQDITGIDNCHRSECCIPVNIHKIRVRQNPWHANASSSFRICTTSPNSEPRTQVIIFQWKTMQCGFTAATCSNFDPGRLFVFVNWLSQSKTKHS